MQIIALIMPIMGGKVFSGGTDMISLLLASSFTLVNALIAGYVGLKSSSISHTEEKQRANWFFDEYMMSVGKCMIDYDANKETYYSCYVRYINYADDEILEQMNIIDGMLQNKQDKEKIISNLLKIREIYNKKYDMNQFQLVKRKQRII